MIGKFITSSSLPPTSKRFLKQGPSFNLPQNAFPGLPPPLPSTCSSHLDLNILLEIESRSVLKLWYDLKIILYKPDIVVIDILLL